MSTDSSSACSSCGVQDCPTRNHGCDEPEEAGARLASAAVLTFLLPLVCAMLGAALVPGDGGEAWRIGAAFLGLALGTLIARLLTCRKVSQ